VGASELAPNSVYSVDIANGTILNEDINAAAAIAVSKIFGDIGFDYWQAQTVVSESWTTGVYDMRNLASVSITAPTSGYVLVLFNGYMYCDNEDRMMRVGVGTTSSTHDVFENVGRPEGTGTVTLYGHFTTTRVYDVAAGTHTYYGNVEGYSSYASGDAWLYPKNLIAIFIPDAKRY